MPYVSRIGGVISGVYAVLQPGEAEEWLEDNDPEVVAFLTFPSPPYILPVSLLWMRLGEDEEEAEAFDAKMAVAKPLSSRKAFNAAQTLLEGSDLFNFTKQVMLSALSAARTDVVMGRPLVTENASSAGSDVMA